MNWKINNHRQITADLLFFCHDPLILIKYNAHHSLSIILFYHLIGYLYIAQARGLEDLWFWCRLYYQNWISLITKIVLIVAKCSKSKIFFGLRCSTNFEHNIDHVLHIAAQTRSKMRSISLLKAHSEIIWKIYYFTIRI